MAYRRKSWFRRIMVLGILSLAIFGGWTLYKQNQEQVNGGVQKVSEGAKRVSEVLK